MNALITYENLVRLNHKPVNLHRRVVGLVVLSLPPLGFLLLHGYGRSGGFWYGNPSPHAPSINRRFVLLRYLFFFVFARCVTMAQKNIEENNISPHEAFVAVLR